MRWFLLITALAVATCADAQISGTFKVSKLAKTTYVEQFVFAGDGSVDVTYGQLRMAVSGALRAQERVTHESRGSYKNKPLPEMRTAFTDPTWQPRFENYLKSGHDLFILVQFQNAAGQEDTLFLVRKGNELVNMATGEIYRKSMWSF